ncbi:MAG TPA: hypothetical protein VGJ38_16175 [Jatrophihabitantaceae bacterium]
MSPPSWVGSSASTPELRPDASGPWVTRRDLRVGGVLVGCLAFAGVLLGFVWLAIAPRAHGFAYLNHTVVPLENESFVASDGRFLLLTAGVGLAAGLLSWLDRASRGPAVAAALGAGGLLGAVLTEVVGRVTGGGKTTGALGDTLKLPITVHAPGLLLAEPVSALFVYGVFVLFAKRDDLARPVEPDPHADLVPASPLL